jgi:hypothetical protein
MGFLHDQFSTFVAVSKFLHSAGTWTASVASNIWYSRRTAADAAGVTYIPLGDVPQRDGSTKGVQLESVDVHFRVVTAALDSLAAVLYKATLGADGSLLTVAAVTTSYDAGHDTAAERIDVDEHRMTLTPSVPAFLDDNEYLFVEVSWDAAATSVLDFFGAMANWTWRL